MGSRRTEGWRRSLVAEDFVGCARNAQCGAVWQLKRLRDAWLSLEEEGGEEQAIPPGGAWCVVRGGALAIIIAYASMVLY